MNLTINSLYLAHELRLLNKIAPTKPSVPILSHVLMRAEDNKLQFYATDLEIGVQTECEIKVHVPGTAAIPVAHLLAMVEQFPNAEVHLQVIAGQAQVTCGAFTSRLQMLSADDFPQLPAVDGQPHILDAAELRRLIAQTRYAVSDKAGRYFLQGALLKFQGAIAAMVATDGKQLALATMTREGSDAQVILPDKTLEVLSLQEATGDMTVTLGARHLFFTVDGRVIVSRMIEGEFPNYQRIIPQDNHLKATVDRMTLAAALRRVGLVSEETHAAQFAFTAEGLNLTSSSAAVGDAAERVAMTYEGEPVTIWVNWQYVLRALDASSAPVITLRLKDARSPMLLDSGSNLAVILPISAG